MGPPAAPARATTSSPIQATRRLPLAMHRRNAGDASPVAIRNGLHSPHEDARILAIAAAFFARTSTQRRPRPRSMPNEIAMLAPGELDQPGLLIWLGTGL